MDENTTDDQAVAASEQTDADTNPVAMTSELDEPKRTTPVADIFWWANNTDAVKDSISIELFLFSKNYAVYSTNFDKDLLQQMKVLFLLEMVNEVNVGAATGMSVRDFEGGEAEENVLQRTDVANVQHVQEITDQLNHDGDSLEIFSEADHEFKRIKGVVAKFTHTSMEQPFYIVKAISGAQVMHGSSAWMFRGGGFKQFDADAGLRITPDSQVLIIGEDVFVFNQAKFEKLFNYDIKKQAIAESKVKEIESHYKLSFPEGMTLNNLVKDKKSTINKLQKLEVGAVTQEQVIEHAAEMDLELMVDDAGAIIIMDGKDLDQFVGLLNDDYMESAMTGIKYVVKGKKRLDEKSDDAA